MKRIITLSLLILLFLTGVVFAETKVFRGPLAFGPSWGSFTTTGTAAAPTSGADSGFLIGGTSGGTVTTWTAIPLPDSMQAGVANWKSVGQVDIQISADNGVNWTAVYNGIPFVLPANQGGTQLK